jgi:hypothetical protein
MRFIRPSRQSVCIFALAVILLSPIVIHTISNLIHCKREFNCNEPRQSEPRQGELHKQRHVCE